MLLFEPGVIQFDPDLVDNSNGALETLVCTNLPISWLGESLADKSR